MVRILLQYPQYLYNTCTIPPHYLGIVVRTQYPTIPPQYPHNTSTIPPHYLHNTFTLPNPPHYPPHHTTRTLPHNTSKYRSLRTQQSTRTLPPQYQHTTDTTPMQCHPPSSCGVTGATIWRDASPPERSSRITGEASTSRFLLRERQGPHCERGCPRQERTSGTASGLARHVQAVCQACREFEVPASPRQGRRRTGSVVVVGCGYYFYIMS